MQAMDDHDAGDGGGLDRAIQLNNFLSETMDRINCFDDLINELHWHYDE
jgi:hypothetical protein